MLDDKIVEHCAPALAGLKTANMFNYRYLDDRMLRDEIDQEKFDAVAFGCPAMGDEVLEEDSFEPMFSACEGKLSGKKIALFGSYGWGDGAWMEDWTNRCKDAGAVLAAESVICLEAPDDEAKEKCEALGKALA